MSTLTDGQADALVTVLSLSEGSGEVMVSPAEVVVSYLNDRDRDDAFRAVVQLLPSLSIRRNNYRARPCIIIKREVP